MSNKIKLRKPTRTPGGRAEKEAFPGAAALITQARRHEHPFLLAQTKPMSVKDRLLSGEPIMDIAKEQIVIPVQAELHSQEENLRFMQKVYRALNTELRVALIQGEFERVAQEIGCPAVELRKCMEHAGLAPPLQPEPTPAMVNPVAEPTTTTESPLFKDMKVSFTTAHFTVVTNPDNATLIGRLGTAAIHHPGDQPDKVVIDIPRNPEKGHLWGAYRQDELRNQQHAKHVHVTGVEQTDPLFGLSEVESWEEIEGGIRIIMLRSNLRTLRRSERPNGVRPHNKRAPVGKRLLNQSKRERKSATSEEERLERVSDTPVTVETLGTQEQLAERVSELSPEPIREPVIDDEPQPAPAAICIVEPRLKTDEHRKQLEARVAMVNASKRELGDDLQLMIDTTTGELRARTRVSIWQDVG